MRTANVALWAALTMSLIPAASGAASIPPADEAAKDPSFLAFRQQLQAAIDKKDAPGLLRFVDAGVKNSFGGDDGLAAFQRTWALNDPGKSQLWKVLGEILALGGRFQIADGRKTFVAPSLFVDFEKYADEYDSFESLVAIKPDVAVRAKPDDKSTRLAVLNYGIVKMAGEQQKTAAEWTRVEMPGKRIGYVRSADLRSPAGHRAYFEKKKGIWKLTVLVAGD